ncbi:MAG: hypothetical protein IJ706_07110 [Clostridia bacterium]|nr:hypothetical protein [Clostridia bacterium]
MNNDFLRINSEEKDEDIAVGEYYVGKEEIGERKKKKSVTVFSMLKTIRAAKKSGNLSDTLKIPDTRGIFSAFLIFSVCDLVLIFTALIARNTSFLFFASVAFSFLFPIFSIMFFYMFNTRRNVGMGEIAGAAMAGLLVYVILKLFYDLMPKLFEIRAWAKDLISSATIDILLFFIAKFFVKMCKKDDMFSAMLLTICVFAGFAFIRSADSLFSVLLNVKAEIKSGYFVNGKSVFDVGLENYLLNLLFETIYLNLMYFAWSVICGALNGITVSPVKPKGHEGSSVYLLLVLFMVLHAMVAFTPAILFFNIFLDVISFIVSFIVAYNVLNYALGFMKFEVKNTDVSV